MIFHITLGIGCSNLTTSKVDKGTIEYTISYPNIPEDSYLLDLMPKKMETHFLDGSFRSDIVAGMGLFKVCRRSVECVGRSECTQVQLALTDERGRPGCHGQKLV